MSGSALLERGAGRPQRRGGAGRFEAGVWLRGAAPCGLVALALLAFYVPLYPWRGFRVALGSDTPVYVWWARGSALVGLKSSLAGGRPVTVGALAALAGVTRTSPGVAIAPLSPVLAVAIGLATAALVDVVLGRDRRRFFLVALLSGAFLALLVPGYLSTLAFGASFVAGLACLVESLDPTAMIPAAEELPRTSPPWIPVAAAGVLIGAAGLAHPLFLGLAAPVLAGGFLALLPRARREVARGVHVTNTGSGRVALAGLGGALIGAIILTLGHAAGTAVDTSRDSILRRIRLGRLRRLSFQRVLLRFFPWYRSLTLVGLASFGATRALGWGRDDSSTSRHGHEGTPESESALEAPTRSDRSRLFWGVMAAWIAVTGAAVTLLLAGTGAPGQRLAAFCLPLPILAAVGLGGLDRGHSSRSRRRTRTLLIAGASLFVLVAWLFWSKQQPLLSKVAAQQFRQAGAALAAEPPGTPLILVADDRTRQPAFSIARDLNYLRDSVPADRIAEVHVFVGPPVGLLGQGPTETGLPEHDRMAFQYWGSIRPLLGRQPAPLAVVLKNIDPEGYAAVFRMPAFARHPARFRLAPGVIALPGVTGSAQLATARAIAPHPHGSGTVLISPWLPVWLAPILLLLLAGVGYPWILAVIPQADTLIRWSLAPAFGVAAVGLGSIAVDALGVRLGTGGSFAATGLALAGGGVAARLRRPPPEQTGSPLDRA